jgi:carboxypeptidase family protein
MQMNGIFSKRMRVFVPAAAVAIVSLATAAVPARALTNSVPPDTIRGIVFDSLLHQPIPDATVQADAGGVATTTDKEGRFTLMASEPIHHITVFHDFLDRTGLGSLQADVTPQTSHAMMVLSTPSLATIWSKLCGTMALEKGRGGIVFGSVRAPDGKTRLEGAQVRVSWNFSTPASTAASSAVKSRTSDTRSDATGSYVACGAPPSENVFVTGYSKTLTSSPVEILGDTLPIRRLDLVLGENGKTATIRGVVRDPRKTPFVGATINVDGVTTEVKTDANGHFTMTNVPTGSRTMGIRGLGYAPVLQPIAVLEGQNDEIQIDLVPASLTTVNITGRKNVSATQLDFEQRKREGFGTFKDSTEIVKFNSIRSIFQGIPSLVITGIDNSSFGLFTPQLSITNNPVGGCPVNVYVDGKPSDLTVLITLSKEQIAAIEVYIRQEFAPARYILLSNNCGVVLVWTKLEFMKK